MQPFYSVHKFPFYYEPNGNHFFFRLVQNQRKSKSTEIWFRSKSTETKRELSTQTCSIEFKKENKNTLLVNNSRAKLNKTRGLDIEWVDIKAFLAAE